MKLGTSFCSLVCVNCNFVQSLAVTATRLLLWQLLNEIELRPSQTDNVFSFDFPFKIMISAKNRHDTTTASIPMREQTSSVNLLWLSISPKGTALARANALNLLHSENLQWSLKIKLYRKNLPTIFITAPKWKDRKKNYPG